MKSIILLSALLFAGAASTSSPKAMYFNDFNSREECLEAAGALNREIAEEGITLLKNDGSLPFRGNEYVSVFGVRSDSLTGGSASVQESLKAAGFHVNPTLTTFYEEDSSSIGKERTDFNGTVKASMSTYSDAAFIVLSRAGGEGSDQSTVTDELVDEKTDTHADLKEGTKDGKTVHYKHSLMLTDSEEELVAFVKKNFGKIVVVLNTSNPMEVENLQNDPQINAILHVSRPGETGIYALGDILNGTVNPSGRIQDNWDADHSADPTWQNFGNNGQVNAGTTMLDPKMRTKDNLEGTTEGNIEDFAYNSYFDGLVSYEGKDLDYTHYTIDYEEGIYIGYKYYETRYADMYAEEPTAATQWFDNSVTYPYGYGLSYTTFSMNIVGVYQQENGADEVADGKEFAAADFQNAPGQKAKIDKLYVKVKVKNTGTVAGKQPVQLYVHAPYTQKLEKADHVLVAFGKTDVLNPGEEQELTLSFNVQDIASWDMAYEGADGKTGAYTLEKGDYQIRVLDSSHYDRSITPSDDDAIDTFDFNLAEDTHMTADDFSLKEVSNKFTNQEKEFDPEAIKNGDYQYSFFKSLRTGEIMADGTSSMTVMSRSDFEGTFPTAPTAADRTFNEYWYKNITYWMGFDQDSPIKNDRADYNYKDSEDDPWYITNDDIPADWTQIPNADVDKKAEIQFADMAGIDYTSTEKIVDESSPLNGLTGVEAWTKFMNQLSWEQVASLVEFGGYGTTALENVGKAEDKEADGPNNVQQSYQWCDEPLIAATFNKELAKREGQIVGDLCLFENLTGWYGPGFNYHRSPFSGRNNEYYSQDAYVCGTIGSYVIQGAQSKGVVCYAKHIAFNDQETNRGEVYQWVDEQTMRENDLKSFQIAFQEGGCKSGMVGYGHISGLPNTNNYNLLTGIYKNEWDWKGVLDTDGYIGWINITSPDLMNRAGCELELRTPPWYETPSGTWDASLRDGKGGVKVKTGEDGALEESPNQYYYTRLAATRILGVRATSNGLENGYSTLIFNGKDITINQFEDVKDQSVALPATSLKEDSYATYSITDGKLPEGLTLNRDGSLSGKAETSGDYTVTVEALIDGWIEKTATFKISVTSAFSLNKDGDDPNAAKIGQDFMTKIESSVFTTENGKFDSVTYEVESGKLPDGITIDDEGIISGTPNESGTFTAVIKVTGTKKSSGGGGGGFPGGGDFPGGGFPGGGFPGGGDFPGGGFPGGGFPGGGDFPGGGGSTSSDDTTGTYTFTMTVAPADPVPTKTFTVTFNTNGGDAIASQTVEEGATLASVPNPTRQGYNFLGWFTDSACTTKADLNTPITSDVTFYAGWEKLVTSEDIQTAIDDIDIPEVPEPTDISGVEKAAKDAKNVAIVGTVLGAIGIVAAIALAIVSFLKRRP